MTFIVRNYHKRFILLIVVSIFFVGIAACSGTGSNEDSVEKHSNSSNSICGYVDVSTSYLLKTRRVLESTSSKLKSGASLENEIGELGKMLSDYGRISPPEDSDTLQTLTTGTIASAKKLLEAFEAGSSGEKEAQLHVTLLDSTTKEIKRLKEANGCQ